MTLGDKSMIVSASAASFNWAAAVMQWLHGDWLKASLHVAMAAVGFVLFIRAANLSVPPRPQEPKEPTR